MSGEKGVMLAERPTVSASTTGAGGLDAGSSSSIGNYKGVMLCNRPFAESGGGSLRVGDDPTARASPARGAHLDPQPRLFPGASQSRRSRADPRPSAWASCTSASIRAGATR